MSPLEKMVWTDADFDRMSWHDATVHAFASSPETYEYMFDIDYLVQWVPPTPPQLHFDFWIAPATLVFHNAHTVRLDQQSGQGEFTLQGLGRSNARLTPNGKRTEWLWQLDGNEGEITFDATGFSQYFRRQAALTGVQQLTLAQRGGISFAREVVTP